MSVGLYADTDYIGRAEQLGALGMSDFTMGVWHYRPSGIGYAATQESAILGVTHFSNGRYQKAGFDNFFVSGLETDARFCVESHGIGTPAAPPDDAMPFDTWVYVLLRADSTPGGTIYAEWSELGSGTWHSISATNNVDVGAVSEGVLLGRGEITTAQTAQGRYAYCHVFNSDIGQASARALKGATGPTGSPWAFWRLADNTDTADTSGNGRTVSFSATFTSESDPALTTPQWLLVQN